MDIWKIAKRVLLKLKKTPNRIIINVTEFMKHLGLYIDLARKREIVFTRYQGEKIEFFGLLPVDNIYFFETTKIAAFQNKFQGYTSNTNS